MHNKNHLLEVLTGVNASRNTYYTELKATVSQLQRQNQLLELLNQLARRITLEMNFSDLLALAREQLHHVVPVDRLSLALFEDSRLIFMAANPSLPELHPPGVPLTYHSGLFQQVASLQKCFFDRDIACSAPYQDERRLYMQEGFHTVVVLPLIARGITTGVLGIQSRTASAFDSNDLSALEQMADLLAIAMDNYQAYTRAQKSQKKWEDTFRAVSDHLIIIDDNFRVLNLNDSAKEFYGIKALNPPPYCYEVLCQQFVPCEDCIVQETMSSLKRQQKRVQRGNPVRILDVAASPIFDDAGKLWGVVKSATDVTERLKMQEQMIMSEKLAAVGQMAAGIAHEINSPLTAILGNAQLIMMDISEEESEFGLVSDIVQCGRRCKNIIQNLLTFSRQNVPEFSKVQVNDVVNRTLLLFAYQIKRANIDLEIRLAPNLPAVWGNEHRLEQVIVNLTLNSRDAVEEKIHNLPLDKDFRGLIEIQTDFCSETSQVEILIRDNGTGISLEAQKEIFSPFYTTKAPGKGTGLGLSVSMGIIQDHSGILELTSSTDEGTTFKIYLSACSTREEGFPSKA